MIDGDGGQIWVAGRQDYHTLKENVSIFSTDEVMRMDRVKLSGVDHNDVADHKDYFPAILDFLKGITHG